MVGILKKTIRRGKVLLTGLTHTHAYTWKKKSIVIRLFALGLVKVHPKNINLMGHKGIIYEFPCSSQPRSNNKLNNQLTIYEIILVKQTTQK